MSAAKHTPWFADSYRVYRCTNEQDKRAGAILADGKHFDHGAESEELALMAAAPEMFDALVAVQRDVGEFGVVSGSSYILLTEALAKARTVAS